MVEKVINIGNWLKTLTANKAGVFVLGMLIGFSTPAFLSFFLYQQLQEEKQRTTKQTELTDKWVNTAFNSQNSCFENMKSYSDVLKHLRDEQKSYELRLRQNIDKLKKDED